jgi:hypothetical protein
MLLSKHMSTPMKNEIIINPKTSRPIRVGSRAWLTLVKEGVIEGRYSDPKELGTVPEHPEDVEDQIEEVNKKLPKGQQAVRGRGKYKGKLVKRNQQLAPEEVSKYTAQVASRAVINNINTLVDNEDENIEGMLEKMILAEMMNDNTKASTRRPRGRPKKTEETYEEIAPNEYDYEDDDEEIWE